MAATALIGALRVDLSMNSAAFKRAASEAQRAITQMNQRMGAISANLRTAGSRLGLAVSAPVIGGFAAVIRASGNFEQAMNRVSALSGATGAEFAQLKSVAQELGATTKFSASEAADA
ncbi:MAG: phage tail tape measure protein, partial [Paracoccaceae bacterium]|nr:phage tail tape measure protein [Paracoccaceae bacterium]